VVVITGTRSPMCTRAFSLFFTRMRGLASTLAAPVVLLQRQEEQGVV
jgi:hypothetical protein